MLPATALETAAQTFASMRQLSPALTVTIICMTTPPDSATPSTPIIMMAGSYFGPSHEGEKAASALFNQELTSQAISTATELVPFADANIPLTPWSANGGHKGFSSTFLDTIDADTIQAGVARWLQLCEQHEDARRTTLVFNRWDTAAIIATGQTDIGRAKFFEHRRPSMVANAMRWCTKEETRSAVDQFGDEFLEIVRRNESGPWHCIANNQRPGMDMEELYSRDTLVALEEVKATWDPHGVFWSPSY
jgi:hypothetical protein